MATEPEALTWRVRGRAALWVLLLAASLAALGIAAATTASIALVYPETHYRASHEVLPAFTEFVLDGALMWPFWLAGAFVLSVLLALVAWWRARSFHGLHNLLALLACLNLLLAFAATAAVLAGYFVLPETKTEAGIRADAAR
ncbi:hypothetical protein [Arenimonas composti]|uniref:Uncharacterized protein n=1 Tax=Arenimonas composti TR7-09 = DSM 18010 TaxID=1121013 RepID=A0A091BDM7_9GAMM|nr:hypothetical protein [Arenimonas composti]KFN49846.1 hypothetical protein P873_08980 [Arenimonas composti TR7-09 = DSM 18010]